MPKRNLLFAAYCDEEYGGSHGAMTAVMKHPTERIVSMDGRQRQIWNCASGGGVMKYTFHTKFSADSAWTAGRAISVVMDAVDAFGEKRRAELLANPYYAGSSIPQTALRYMEVRAGNAGMDMGNGEVHFVFYTDKTKAEIDRELAELEKIIAERLAPLDIEGEGFTPTTRFFHYVSCAPDSDDILAMRAAALEATAKEPKVCGSCLSDLSVISKYGSSRAFGFGCGREFSDEGGAHQPNEFILCDMLLDYTKTVAAYVVNTLG